MKDKEKLNDTELKIFNQLLGCAFSYGALDYETKSSGCRESFSDFDSNLYHAESLLNILGGSDFKEFILNNREAYDEYLEGIASYLDYCNIDDLPKDLNQASSYEELEIYLDEDDQKIIITKIKENQEKKTK